MFRRRWVAPQVRIKDEQYDLKYAEWRLIGLKNQGRKMAGLER